MTKSKFEQVINIILEKVKKIMENTGAVGNKECLADANSQLNILQGYLEGLLVGFKEKQLPESRKKSSIPLRGIVTTIGDKVVDAQGVRKK